MDAPMIAKKDALFAAWRHPFSSFSPDQVKGVEGLVDAWNAAAQEGRTAGLRQAEAFSYICAGVKRETGGKMYPVREGYYLAPGREWTDADARRFVKSQRYAYDTPISGKYPVKIGEGDPIEVEVNAVVYYGRGRIQNTWQKNLLKLAERFKKPELLSNPDLLLTDWDLDAEVTIAGHLEGIWSSAKLAWYFAEGKVPNPLQARQIVNGHDHAQEIAGTYAALLPGVRAAME